MCYTIYTYDGRIGAALLADGVKAINDSFISSGLFDLRGNVYILVVKDVRSSESLDVSVSGRRRCGVNLQARQRCKLHSVVTDGSAGTPDQDLLALLPELIGGRRKRLGE